MIETEVNIGAKRETHPTVDWSERFLESLSNPESVTARMVEAGVGKGLAKQGRETLAREMGEIFNFAYITETGAEKCSEDLDYSDIETKTGISVERQRALVELMVSSDFMKSKEAIKKRNQNANGN